ncbi:hypothetical protein SPRG_07510 [Saprolegnia parasitica CBS 223.65]|uniref:Fibronectin type-III domain-containing protein n=1 Tax=Saprolegnia parasitica (strain CBS 223.65) TaxID=695850 RepID=A0A067CL49_SAPPC|nr:hypothetical protein SPRG_07510 [Saprolegnia parasitica CBS 223.65]KDO27261.1 hypothetical protein SPRG_07510 [Saprolegnia parasitica CBS 223.65]|eukprot:XP_012202038.1 hypothetical protein SPRG_07510 [Saprolegnia parasitica CBS 223.65]
MRTLVAVLCAWLLALGVHAKTTMTVARRELLSTGHVEVLNGTAGALALAFYLTAPADLHYAIVESGRDALIADDIKAAAVGNASAYGVVVASTIVSETAQRLRWSVSSLTPNVSYDVYFVAEVSKSNGVFGTVVSVNGTTTHPEAPLVRVLDHWAQHATTTMAALSVNVTFPGLLHYVVVPIEASQNLSSLDIWHNVTGATRSAHIANGTLVNITHLTPFTTYDVWYVAEVDGSHGVLGAPGYIEHAFTTFAVAPTLGRLACAPLDASTTSVQVAFRLEFPRHAFESNNVKASRKALQYHIHYVAFTDDEAAFPDGRAITSAVNTTTQQQVGTVAFSLPTQPTDAAVLVSATATTVDVAVNVSSLGVGTPYTLAFVLETMQSDGVFSNAVTTTTTCATHAAAPSVDAVVVTAQNTTTDVLVATVTLDRIADVHVIVGLPRAFREVPMALSSQLSTYLTTYNASFRHITLHASSNVSSPMGALLDVQTHANLSYTMQVAVGGLEAATIHGLLVLAETSHSHGVYSTPFPTVEARTHEPAGDVTVAHSGPVLGSTSQLEVHASSSDRRDQLVVCYTSETNRTAHCTELPPNGVLGNLSADTLYDVSVHAVTAHGVESNRVDLAPLRTHAAAPSVETVTLRHRPGVASLLDASITTTGVGFVHSLIVPTAEVDGWTLPSREALLSHATRRVELPRHARTSLVLDNLLPNTSYSLLVLLESAYAGNASSAVFSDAVVVQNLTTYARAPTILQSTVLPANASIDAIVMTANLSSPGRVHYMVSDIAFDDPLVLRTSDVVQPNVRRGFFDVTERIYEARNATVDGVNVTEWHPLDVYNNTVTLPTLASATLYHVYLATETFDSDGVFGVGLPPPHVVTTHAPPPTFDVLRVTPAQGVATSIELSFGLSSFGNVHYILLHRGLYVVQDTRNATEIPANETCPTSAVEVATLTAADIKAATLDRLGVGVVDNGTIAVSRDEWQKHADHGASKTFTSLRPGSLYELCAVPETDASEGVFAAVVCAPVRTHADYTNLSLAYDELTAAPVNATTNGVLLTWKMTCLGDCGRDPYFVLTSDAFGGRSELHLPRDTPFHRVAPGQPGIVAAGRMQLSTTVASDDRDAVVVTYHADVRDLEPHASYHAFFAAETQGSGGVFSRINANGNATTVVAVTTHASAPRLRAYRAEPTYGNTTGIDVVVDFDGAEGGAIVHTLVTPANCAMTNPRCVLLNETHAVAAPQREVKDHVLFLENGLLLSPNTSYDVYIATETVGSFGVVSPWRQTSVRTHPPAPRFTTVAAKPKSASTTELELSFALSAPGIVHFMVSDDSEHIEVASVYNVSAKKPRGSNDDWHRYGFEKVKWRRSVPASTTVHTELLQLLVQNTNYSLHLVVETKGDAGIYGPITVLRNISTFGHAPLLLAHEAAPTPASTSQLRVQYKLNTYGVLHCLVTMASRWRPTAPDVVYGNVLGLDHTIVAQKSLLGDAGTFDVDVPLANQTYDVLLVTETAGSDGVYGTVARLDAIKSSDVAPVVDQVNVSATDARNDALNVRIVLNTVGIVYYSPALKGATPTTDRTKTHLLSNASMLEATLLLDGLAEGTLYDIYIQTETLGSYGVLGPLLRVDNVVPTHGPPPLILEEVDCAYAPACDALGREPCLAVTNTCGECLVGFVGDRGAHNTACTQAASEAPKPRKAKKSIGIKISSAKAHAEPKSVEPAPVAVASVSVAPVEAAPLPPADAAPAVATMAHVDMCPAHAHASLTNAGACECDDGYLLDNGVCTSLCPPNSFPSGPGKCQCDPGFALDALGTSCVLATGSGLVGIGLGSSP